MVGLIVPYSLYSDSGAFAEQFVPFLLTDDGIQLFFHFEKGSVAEDIPNFC